MIEFDSIPLGKAILLRKKFFSLAIKKTFKCWTDHVETIWECNLGTAQLTNKVNKFSTPKNINNKQNRIILKTLMNLNS